ncbi:rab GTPase-binding effector protein 1 isoform X3 [Bos indicus]|uniref:Rab GTPase-binding effector protein 1 isoform X3 n=1 Tax=Bos indicus TaxID=9915 RepID=A0ABM4R0C3_BOSIN|nr:rab GTPase-binding effector protein 1 isoform X3 [Bos taurus]XP_017919954.1 PREDICTED: rab GTPase-binding effector protein 1 isoform X4 [Capra hircus]XP_027373131.1 rab GTPase-binding effector protein 1 isoform X3 [Bos indicus x Bos taurus]XP_055432778.1 rab GTPase-binding effector protein 1 isoform X5 [Bubalus carabanensis]XP_061246815.1 rab GTPase-binding effector protein 1 isoform X4 [Bos javanicus]
MAQPGPAPQPDVSLQQRVAELEKINAEFLRAKQQLEQEFNQKRAKFKELYLAKEEDLKRQNAVLQAAQDDLGHLRTQLWEAQAEMENIKAIATVSENTKQEAIDEVKRQWREEVASLQAVMKETVRDYEHQFHLRLEQERTQWAQYRESAEREIADLRRRLSEGQEEENLENEMKKAQEDAEKLRSVVMPMEKEIAALKDKLTEAEDKIKELEASKVKELNHYLEAEKSCRTDLEMYVAVLNTQKSVLQEDAEKLRKELHEVCHLLEQERQQHNQLKHTWQKANDQFLESQRLLMRDMQRMEIVLTSEQLRQVEELKKKDQEEDEQQRLSKRKDHKKTDVEEEVKIPVVCALTHEESSAQLSNEEIHNAGNKLGRRCDMCSNYEKQLQGIQIQEAETRDQVKKLQVMLRQANDQLEKTMKDKQELEDFIKQSTEDSSHQISALVLRAQASEILLEELQQGFSQAKRDVQEQMAVLMQSREQVSEELVRLQKDNDSLQGKHSLHVSLQQAEDFILPDTMEALRELVLKYRENIVNVRTAADHMEEKLKAEILFLKEQIQAEQCLKENLEETLQLEIENCKEEIASISSLKAELERIKVEKGQLESTLREKSQQLESLQEMKMTLEEQLKKETAAKVTVEQLMFEEKNKAQRLQTELDVSEQVQRDFVKLSQTLQVQLERIRQADSLERIRAILNDTKLTDINQLPET